MCSYMYVSTHGMRIALDWRKGEREEGKKEKKREREVCKRCILIYIRNIRSQTFTHNGNIQFQ